MLQSITVWFFGFITIVLSVVHDKPDAAMYGMVVMSIGWVGYGIIKEIKENNK
jgi:hypothetical protein